MFGFADVPNFTAGKGTTVALSRMFDDGAPKKVLGAAEKKESGSKGDKEKASACAEVSAALVLQGDDAAAAVEKANESVKAAQKSKDKKLEGIALLALANALVAKGDPVEACRSASQARMLFEEAKDKSLQAAALDASARAYASDGFHGEAIRTAEEGLALETGSPAILETIHSVYSAQGKAGSALRIAKELLGGMKGKKDVACAQLMVGTSYPEHKDSCEGAKAAVTAFRELNDKGAEACALVVLARALISQTPPMGEQGLKAAKDALATFQAKDDQAAAANAMNMVAHAHMAIGDADEAEKAGNEAVTMFRALGDSAGESTALATVNLTQTVSLKPCQARLLIDDMNTVHIEVNELATQESMEAIIHTLQSYNYRAGAVKAMCLHVEGISAPPECHFHGMSSGAFMIGLRSIGVPIIGVCWGRISGPSWGLVLGADYRMALANTEFVLPLWCPPECLGDLIGHSIAVELCMTSGTMSGAQLLELGVLHQAHENKEFASKAAHEFAKRLAGFPAIALRQTMSLMCPVAERYALNGMAESELYAVVK